MILFTKSLLFVIYSLKMKKFFCTSSSLYTKSLMSPIKLGPYDLPNRIVMAAMTRCRADTKTAIPNDLHVKYYSERSENSAFVLTECTAVSKGGLSYPGACGVWTDEQVEGWKRVVDAVHEKQGRIYIQLWHGGRASKKIYTGEKPVAPSNVTIRTPSRDGKSIVYSEEPEVLDEDGIKKVVEQFQKGAENAMKAGFDGVELHGGNGFIIDQFLRDWTNKREDQYGGSIENRCRFPLMVIDALTSVYGNQRVGIKISPVGRYKDMIDSNPIPLFKHFIKELNERKISFIELMRGPETLPGTDYHEIKPLQQIPNMFETFKPIFDGVLIGNNSLTYEEANQLIKYGVIDMASFARPYIANPDLVERFKNSWPLSTHDPKYLYTGKGEGYITYLKYKA
jgi:N-ethylmaleimide reductase